MSAGIFPMSTTQYRVLIYSHDSFGLGHLSRCRAIAQSLVENRRDVSVLILSGLPIIGSYSFPSRVDFIRFPGVVKLRDGGYSPRGLDISIEDAIKIRQTVIRSAAESFQPHVFIVDKEPLGLRGEVESTLRVLKARGTRLVLGLRDVMDDPDDLRDEWARKAAMPALVDLYDDIWVYGCEAIYDPLAGIDMPQSVHDKITFTGYLRRRLEFSTESATATDPPPEKPFLLVTTGGGGDGAALIDWVLRAYEHESGDLLPAYVVFGPFMKNDAQTAFRQRVEHLPKVTATTFVPNIGSIMREAAGVVAMGGYNTFCEILSYDRPALIVPRTTPRLEQYIRASRTESLGLVRMLPDDGSREPARMAAALRELPNLNKPSAQHVPGLMDGFSTINSVVDQWLHEHRQRDSRIQLVAGGTG